MNHRAPSFCSAPRIRTALLPLVAALAATASAQFNVGYVGRPELEFKAPADKPLNMPTAVAVSPSGRVYVADGVNDRVAIFAAGGDYVGEINAAGALPLSRPIGLKVDKAGQVWIADSGHLRIVVTDPNGGLVREIPVPDIQTHHGGGVTDLALSPDESELWVVANQQHQLLRLQRGADTWSRFGGSGEALGEYRYPFMLATAPSGDLIVSDVVNARVQLIDRAGAAVNSLGSYGVELGQLYRPKGVAVDRDGTVWVADSVTGALQMFRPFGANIDVLRKPTGEPLLFDFPCGIAFDAHDALYVVELRENRVRKVRIERAGEIRASIAMPRARPSVGPQQARSCTICHIEWLPTFAEKRESPFLTPPVESPANPVVAQSGTCLSCHDGSVVDSRRRIWNEHGHATGVTPPDGMKVPSTLPLIDGKLACRTCHSAHGGGPPQGDIATAVFLRVANKAGELCMSCHTDKIRGPRFGTHPTGGMPWPVPQTLIDAGARVGPDPRELTCQVCHTPHGAQNEHLLVKGTRSNQLCLSCHDQMRPGMFRGDGHSEHPLEARVTPEQKASVEHMGTQLGDDDKLICLSCHKLHHGKGERFLLAQDLAEGEMCLSCHSDRREMLGSSHDLRSNFPKERNRLGMTVATGGPCSACHLFHRYAREFSPTPADRTGKCTTCHNEGKCAEKKALGPINHPNADCIDCHDPHKTNFASFLRAPAQDVCAKCHSQKFDLVGSRHDALAGGSAWPATDRANTDRCLACHRPHGDAAHGLLRVAPSAGASGHDAACSGCHTKMIWSAGTPQAAVHPQHLPLDRETGGLPVEVGPSKDEAAIMCRTCHDPHGGGARSHLLNIAAGEQPEMLCIKCHSNAQHIMLAGHSASMLQSHGLQSGACLPCHNVHAAATALGPRLLWPLLLTGAAPSATGRPSASGVAMIDTDDVYCTGCHRQGGSAAKPAASSHPLVAAYDPYALAGPGSLPLFDEAGKPASVGVITCRTCHQPHGREAPQEFDPPPPRLAALQLRTFEAPNVCTTCHGSDGLRRFLYFHDPVRRSGPVEAQLRSP